MNVSRHKR